LFLSTGLVLRFEGANVRRQKRPFHNCSFGESQNDQPVADNQSMLRRLYPVWPRSASFCRTVKAFVWATGASILFAHWQGSAPAWLSSWLLPNVPWSLIAGAALGCAVLEAISTALVRRVLPWVGIEIARDSLAWTITEGLVGFAMLALLFLLSTPAVSDWLGGH
jgi:hypothetical protein